MTSTFAGIDYVVKEFVASVMDLLLNDNAERNGGASEILSLFTRIMHKYCYHILISSCDLILMH